MSLRNIAFVQSAKWISIFVDKIRYVENHQKPSQGKTKQGQARQDKTRRHPDRKVSPGFENTVSCDNHYILSFWLCIYTKRTKERLKAGKRLWHHADVMSWKTLSVSLVDSSCKGYLLYCQNKLLKKLHVIRNPWSVYGVTVISIPHDTMWTQHKQYRRCLYCPLYAVTQDMYCMILPGIHTCHNEGQQYPIRCHDVSHEFTPAGYVVQYTGWFRLWQYSQFYANVTQSYVPFQ